MKWKALAPICVMVFLEFLAMGLPLPILPAHVHDTLGFGSFVVGLVIGSQSLITLATRARAGTRSDERGPRSAAILGLVISSLAGIIAALSSAIATPTASLAILLLGRGLLGLGESLVITGALAWGIALVGRERTGVVMAWVGIAMYGALAAGAPLGLSLDGRFGYVGMALAAAAAPVLALAAVPFARTVLPVGGTRLPVREVLQLIALPGAGLALCAVGFGTIATFSTLLFRDNAWAHPALAMTAFGSAYVLARVFFAKLPDRLGGARVALGSAAIAAVGQLGMLFATSGTMAIAAAALTGFGFSLAFPAFGVEAIRRVPPQNRGLALAAYTAWFDATLAFGIPALGAAASAFGHRAAFAIGALAALSSVLVAIVLAKRCEVRVIP